MHICLPGKLPVICTKRTLDNIEEVSSKRYRAKIALTQTLRYLLTSHSGCYEFLEYLRFQRMGVSNVGLDLKNT